MTIDRPALTQSIDRNSEIKLVGVPTHKVGAELVVQGARNLSGNGPGDHRNFADRRPGRRRTGRLLMVKVTRDPTFVERENEVRAYLFCNPSDVRGEFYKRLLGQATIPVTE